MSDVLNRIPFTSADVESLQKKDAERRGRKRGKQGWVKLEDVGEVEVKVPMYIVRPKTAGQPSPNMPIAHGQVFHQDNEDK